LLLALPGCGDSSEATTTTAPTATTTTSAVPETTAEPTEASTTTALETSTTTTTAATASDARFALTMVSLGDFAQVVVQNVGSGPGSLAGYWLCQRPAYYEFPDVELQPGEAAAVSLGGDFFSPPPGAIAIEGTANIGAFDPASGEVGLYRSGSFDDPTAIVSYVEWGSSGHGRSATAVAAEIWTEGGFVTTSSETGAILATVIPPSEPGHWTSG
ncbi:MAG: hypothetical protein QNJ77_03295, partial [Acidimicrobiia bacterium]|nr:hypothetical protein [Acidimicrobiia bacterium]